VVVRIVEVVVDLLELSCISSWCQVVLVSSRFWPRVVVDCRVQVVI
jgi:hypothetical protein